MVVFRIQQTGKRRLNKGPPDRGCTKQFVVLKRFIFGLHSLTFGAPKLSRALAHDPHP
jgi:hypothetical protein